MSNIKLSEVAQNIKYGVYRHFKGGEYKVVGVAFHSETLEEVVVYRALYGNRKLWVRPLENFIAEKQVEGDVVPRFEYIRSE